MESQPIWASTTVQGAVIMALNAIAMFLHLNIGGDLITQLVTGVVGVIGTIMIIYGRITAVKPLSVGGKIL